MNHIRKILIPIALGLCAVGIAIFTITLSVYGFDFRKISNASYVSDTVNLKDSFHSIDIDVSTSDVIFEKSNANECRVEYTVDSKEEVKINVTDDTLVIKIDDERQWFNFFDFHFSTEKVTVYLPENQYEKLAIKCATGDIQLPKDFTFSETTVKSHVGNIDLLSAVTGRVELESDTGDIEVDTLDCNSFYSKSSTGNITLSNVICKSEMRIEQATGDIRLERSDAASIYIKNHTGDIRGSLLSGKDFHAESSIGDVDVPHDSTGGICELSTDVGDISITVE